MQNRVTRGKALVGGIAGARLLESTNLTIGVTNQSDDATIAPNTGIHLIQNSTGNASALYTLSPPTAGDELILFCDSYSTAGADSLKVKCSSTAAGFVTSTGAPRVAVFNAAADSIHVVATSATRWAVISNVGSVAFAATT